MRANLPALTVRQTTHWGEVVQGPVAHGGRLVTALITLPRTDLTSSARFTPCRGELSVTPAWCTRAVQAARAVLDLAGRPELGGQLTIRTNIPPGCGCGSTTADITGTIRAVAGAVGLRLKPEQVQRIDWTIERAADPLALLRRRRAMVYGSRIGETLCRLTRPLPALCCLGFDADPGRSVLTDELAARTAYSAAEAAVFARILQQAMTAIEHGCIRELGRAATHSATLNQTRLPTRNFEELVRCATQFGSAGLAVSHSGTVAAALFDPSTPHLMERMQDLATCLRSLGCGNPARFRVGGE